MAAAAAAAAAAMVMSSLTINELTCVKQSGGGEGSDRSSIPKDQSTNDQSDLVQLQAFRSLCCVQGPPTIAGYHGDVK
ncbi:hypothetical protein INR49_006596 [Caranx melampygus]|nr:hypothetical protein INR49_006596 [Caranx melampygus]